MSVPVKFCGLTLRQHVLAAARLKAWAGGLVFAPSSPRRLSLARALRVSAWFPPGLARVGVFQDQPVEEVLEAASLARLDYIQLHGEEGPLELRALGPRRCIKAVVLDTEEALAQALDCPAAVLLVDGSKATPGAVLRRSSWALARRLAAKRRVLLAGGLTPETAGQAFAAVRPWGLDVSSGVERAPGIKNPGLMEAFVGAVEEAARR